MSNSGDNRWIIPPTHHAPDQMNDSGLEELATGDDPSAGPHVPITNQVGTAKNINPSQWGNAFQGSVIPGTVLPLLSTPPFECETDCVVTLQVLTFPPNSNILFTITYGIGAVSFVKTVLVATTVPKYIFLSARNVQVSARAVNAPGLLLSASTQAYSFKVACVRSQLKLRDFYGWASYGIASSNLANIYAGPGVLGAMHIVLDAVTAAGTPMWVLLFDLDPSGVGPVTTVTKPIPFGVSDTLEDVGDCDSFGGVFVPEAISWTKGLWMALSSTPDVYTAVANGNTVRIDLVVGT